MNKVFLTGTIAGVGASMLVMSLISQQFPGIVLGLVVTGAGIFGGIMEKCFA